MTAQNARAVFYCIECEKPWVVYSKNKRNHNQRMLLAKSISSFQYSCRAFLFPPYESLKQLVLCLYPPHSNVQCKLKIIIMDRMLAELINAVIVERTKLL